MPGWKCQRTVASLVWSLTTAQGQLQVPNTKGMARHGRVLHRQLVAVNMNSSLEQGRLELKGEFRFISTKLWRKPLQLTWSIILSDGRPSNSRFVCLSVSEHSSTAFMFYLSMWKVCFHNRAWPQAHWCVKGMAPINLQLCFYKSRLLEEKVAKSRRMKTTLLFLLSPYTDLITRTQPQHPVGYPVSNLRITQNATEMHCQFFGLPSSETLHLNKVNSSWMGTCWIKAAKSAQTSVFFFLNAISQRVSETSLLLNYVILNTVFISTANLIAFTKTYLLTEK